MSAYEELLKNKKGENRNKEYELGESVGRERIWSMTDEAYEKEYGATNLSKEAMQNDEKE